MALYRDFIEEYPRGRICRKTFAALAEVKLYHYSNSFYGVESRIAKARVSFFQYLTALK